MNGILNEKRKAKISKYAKQFAVKLLIFVLLIGLLLCDSLSVFVKILASFMSQDDLYNSLVDIVPIDWSIENFKYIFRNTDFTIS